MTISSANSFYLIRFPVNSVFELKKYCQTMVGNVRKSNVMATPRFSVASSWPPHKTFLGRPNRQPDRATGMAGCTSSWTEKKKKKHSSERKCLISHLSRRPWSMEVSGWDGWANLVAQGGHQLSTVKSQSGSPEVPVDRERQEWRWRRWRTETY